MMNTETLISAGRLAQVAAAEGGRQDIDRLFRAAQRQGIRREGLREALGILQQARLVTIDEGACALTAEGKEACAELDRANWGALGILLFRLPALARQLEGLLAHAETVDQEIVVPKRIAFREAPQAAVLISWMNDDRKRLRLPSILIDFATLAEADVPTIPVWVEEGARVGERAERYSLLFERTKYPAHHVVHVAAETDALGYDIETRHTRPVRQIEVKGSRRAQVRFFLTRREMDAAVRGREHYEIQFWGEIDLSRSPLEEYGALRALSYPRILPDVASRLESGRFLVNATQWEITDLNSEILET
jgi:hypothetical protein